MPKLTQAIDAPARLLIALLFLIPGWMKLTAVGPTQAYMAMHGLSPLLVWPTIALELGGGLAFLLGLWVRPVALLLAGWCLLTGAVFHNEISDPNQLVNLLKNLALAGALLVVARAGAPGLGVDGLIARRRHARAAAPPAGAEAGQ